MHSQLLRHTQGQKKIISALNQSDKRNNIFCEF